MVTLCLLQKKQCLYFRSTKLLVRSKLAGGRWFGNGLLIAQCGGLWFRRVILPGNILASTSLFPDIDLAVMTATFGLSLCSLSLRLYLILLLKANFCL